MVPRAPDGQWDIWSKFLVNIFFILKPTFRLKFVFTKNVDPMSLYFPKTHKTIPSPFFVNLVWPMHEKELKN